MPCAGVSGQTMPNGEKVIAMKALERILNLLAIAALLCTMLYCSPAPATQPSHRSTPKASADRHVRVFTNRPDDMADGASFQADEIITILFVTEPCPLQLKQHESMRRAWQARGAYQIGCWYPTVDSGFTLIAGDGTFSHNLMAAECYPLALLHPDGSVTIDDPNYGSWREALQRFNDEKLSELFQRGSERP